VSTPEPPEITEPLSDAPPVPEPGPEPPKEEQLPEEDRPSTWQPFLYFKIGLLLAAIGYSIAFVVENSQQINIHFVFATANVHLIWEILLLLAVGLVGGVLLSQLYRHRRRAQLTKKSRKEGRARADVGGGDKAVGKPR
jgi:uncharacterized membrane protein YciS (DUF1049 family)